MLRNRNSSYNKLRFPTYPLSLMMGLSGFFSVIVAATEDQISQIDRTRTAKDGFSWIRQESRRVMRAGELPLEFLMDCILGHAFFQGLTATYKPLSMIDEEGDLKRITVYYPPHTLSEMFGVPKS